MNKFLSFTIIAITAICMQSTFAADEQVRQPSKVECREYQLQQAEAQFLRHKAAEDDYNLVPGYSLRVKQYEEEWTQDKKDILSDPDPCKSLTPEELREIVQ